MQNKGWCFKRGTGAGTWECVCTRGTGAGNWECVHKSLEVTGQVEDAVNKTYTSLSIINKGMDYKKGM